MVHINEKGQISSTVAMSSPYWVIQVVLIVCPRCRKYLTAELIIAKICTLGSGTRNSNRPEGYSVAGWELGWGWGM